MSLIADMPTNILQTQKAQGVRVLARTTDRADSETGGFSHEVCRRTLLYPHHYKEVAEAIQKAVWRSKAVFVRPCPVTPKHGFLDSFRTGEMARVIDAYKQVKTVDPCGEVLVAPVVNATVSGVITPTSFSLGAGNAGVTNGMGCCVEMLFNTPYAEGLNALTCGPLTPQLQGYVTSNWESVNDCPYVEFVSDFSQVSPEIVQLRFGPRPPTGSDFIPDLCILAEEVDLTAMHVADFMAWEGVMKEAAAYNALQKVDGGLKRRVVKLPHYCSMASHWAVQAMLYGVPVVRNVDAQVGTTLPPTDAHNVDVVGLSQWTVGHLANALDLAPQYILSTFDGVTPLNFSVDPSRYLRPVGVATLLAAHHSLHWPVNSRVGAYVARAAVAYVYLGAMCCLGEARHYNKHCDSSANRKRKTKLHYATANWLPQTVFTSMGIGRNAVYTHCLFLGWKTLRKELLAAEEDFNAPGWSGSYGGLRWADCVQHLLNMMDVIDAGVKDPGNWSITNLFTQWHASINATHNGNVPMLTKFVSKLQLDHVSTQPLRLISNQGVVKAIAALGGVSYDY